MWAIEGRQKSEEEWLKLRRRKSGKQRKLEMAYQYSYNRERNA